MGRFKSGFQITNKLILKYGYLWGGFFPHLKFFTNFRQIHVTKFTVLTILLYSAVVLNIFTLMCNLQNFFNLQNKFYTH